MGSVSQWSPLKGRAIPSLRLRRPWLDHLGTWQVDDLVNLERCTRLGDRLDGHIVQGHVDTTAEVVDIDARDGSWNVHFRHARAPHHLTVAKGSITVNGVSLTVVDSTEDGFSITVIPYTWDHTGFHRLKTGDRVNLELTWWANTWPHWWRVKADPPTPLLQLAAQHKVLPPDRPCAPEGRRPTPLQFQL